MTSLRRTFAFLILAAALLIYGAPAGASDAVVSELSPRFARDLARRDANESYGAFVHFSGGSTAEQSATLERRGLRVTSTFPSVDVVFALGAIGDLAALTSLREVTYVEADRKVSLLGDTATWATRARFATDHVGNGPYRDASGAPLSGAGVGVAVIDSGFDGTHPDLADHVAANYKVVCSTPALINTQTEQCFGPLFFEDVPDSDTTGGHGTHVAGIVAGDGTASDGTFRGVAPDASLYGYGIGEGDRILYIAEAFQHILDNYDTFVPRIRVINNSYGDPGGSAYDPNSVYSKLIRAVVAKGVTVVFAAGNDGGDGTSDQTSSFSKDPTPGVISAANYYDNDTGARDAALDDGSSRGWKGHPETYPDLSAPGTFITSTCRPTKPICDLGPTPEWAPNYATLTGTSMATPHIAGAAALLYQARPELTPAEVEDVLQDTAHRFTAGAAYEADPQNPGGLTSVDKGAGLLDVTAALDALGVANSGYGDASAPQTVFSGDGGELPIPGEADIAALSVSEGTDGITYRITRRDASDEAPFFPSYRVYQNVEGDPFVTTVNMTATGPVAPAASTTNTAVATNVSQQGNDIVFTLPFASIGDPAPGSAAHNVWVASYQGALVDSGPGGSGPSQLIEPRYGSYTIFRGAGVPTEPVQEPVATSLSFTSASASSGSYSDAATIEARLVDADGAGVADEAISFTLAGADGATIAGATTDGAGVARAIIPLATAPGDYEIRARFNGVPDLFLASESSAPFTISSEDSALSLVRSGRAPNTTLTATLTDPDSATGIRGRSVTFSTHGAELGTATTNEAGVATFQVPARYSAPQRAFTATFGGDTYYVGSTATT